MVNEQQFNPVKIFTMILQELGFSDIYGQPVTGNHSKTYEYDYSNLDKCWIKIISEDNEVIWGYIYDNSLVHLHKLNYKSDNSIKVYLYKPDSIEVIEEFLCPT